MNFNLTSTTCYVPFNGICLTDNLVKNLHRKVADHEKTPVNGWKLDMMHYISTFEKKSGSVAGSAALQYAAPEIKEIYSDHFTDNAVICDEFGYVSCDKEAGELLFNHLSLRDDGRSTILTTNLAFERWGEIIRDKVLVSALIDRITQHAYLVNMNGESYRLKQTKKINSSKT